MALDRETRQAQRVRLQYVYMSMVSYGLAVSIVAIGAISDILAWRYFVYFLCFAAFVCTGLYILFLSGANLRFADPSLVRTQNLLPLFPLLFLVYHTHSALGRWALLILSMSGLLYGALNLDIRRFLGVVLLYVASYCGLFLFLAFKKSGQLNRDPGELMILASVAMFILQMGLIGSYISRLRTRLADRNRRITEMATHDPLTGGYNRRFLMEVLENENARAERGRIFCVCLMDIDHFKAVNDRYGHGAGDEVLRRCTTKIAAGIRQMDTFGRYGGEEFLLILPETRGRAALAVAERLRQCVQTIAFETADQTFHVTVSMGVAESRAGETYNELLQRADEALYQAKNSGRNRVVPDQAIIAPIRPTCRPASASG